jgi:hypothetical protein
VHSQFGRKAPRRSEFFYQSSERYDPNTDMLAIHAGPMNHSAGKTPLHELLDMHTVLNCGHTYDHAQRLMYRTAEVSCYLGGSTVTVTVVGKADTRPNGAW